ncbi:/ hprK / HPr kinase/phosphorylase /:473412 Reverse [Candidatus Hepatoplasma crinochetorum]|uniref:/ hprK / HPr kinase/phosphorylase /:473412 Reverse n=1 Tax=Candidatus Hepatoplasma crinochetorum TaxID=295596 RepID=A0A0G7ZN85_9MOLU|nr:/ hprK / HPr kinase/phosphorylase /:473412 Reverse [Candidatus Hepatoplasma crinochetorum]
MRKISLKKFISKFNLKIDNFSQNENFENYQFNAVGTTSGNLEILLISQSKDKLIIFDTKVNQIFAFLGKEKFIDGLKKIFKDNKIIVLNKKQTDQEISKIIKTIGFIILETNQPSTEIRAAIEPYLVKITQNPERIHATMLIVYGMGVLLTGESGIGKSEVALELISRKHLFVGDDAIDVFRVAGELYGKSPRITREFLEVRGIGIINIKKLLGTQIIKPESKIDFIINFTNSNKEKDYDRLGNNFSTKTIKRVEIPIIQLPILVGRNIAELVEIAVMNFKQKKYDKYFPLEDLNNRIKLNNKIK